MTACTLDDLPAVDDPFTAPPEWHHELDDTDLTAVTP